MNISFDNKVAMVTGGTRGIGLKCAEFLAANGAKVAVAGVDNIDGAVAAITKEGNFARGYYLDVADTASIGDTVKNIRNDLGEIDILVCSAGVNLGGPRPAETITEAEWDRVLSINTKGLFFCNQSVANQSMIPRNTGAIVNISSQTAFMVGTGRGLPYATSKAAIVHLTRTEAIEWAPHNIRVTAVAPTLTLTDMIRPRLSEKPEVFEKELNNIPLHRFATVEDVANAVCFLASDLASMITGITLPVDGGRISL